MIKIKKTYFLKERNSKLNEFFEIKDIEIQQEYIISQMKRKEMIRMVERTVSEEFEEFEGIVDSVLIEESKQGNTEQFHIMITPTNVEISGKTGKMHEWVRIPGTATETSVPEGSAIDKYIQELELLDSSLKKAELVMDIFSWMKGKKFLFKKKKHGKAYKGHDAKEYWTPVKIIDSE